MLLSSYKRGEAAYFSSPALRIKRKIKSSSQWAKARVNTFTNAIKNEKYKSTKKRFDTDLLPMGNKAK